MKSPGVFLPSFFLLMACFLIGNRAGAQNLTNPADSDPEATRILDALSKKYNSYTSLAVDFELGIQNPEATEEIQQGKLIRQGNQYKLDLGTQTMVSNGEALYVILHSNKEVQINDMPEEEEMSVLSPQSLFSFYKSGDFVYALVNELAQGNQIIQQIEFKPIQEDTEFFKLRLEIDKKEKQPIQIISFGRDGARYSVRFKDFSPGNDLGASFFTFSKEDYPGYYVEDLRQ